MACGTVQRFDCGLGAVCAAHHAYIHFCHIQIRRHVQTGDGQQTALQPRVLQPADDGNDLALHILRKTAHIFLRHSFLQILSGSLPKPCPSRGKAAFICQNDG